MPFMPSDLCPTALRSYTGYAFPAYPWLRLMLYSRKYNVKELTGSHLNTKCPGCACNAKNMLRWLFSALV